MSEMLKLPLGRVVDLFFHDRKLARYFETTVGLTGSDGNRLSRLCEARVSIAPQISDRFFPWPISVTNDGGRLALLMLRRSSNVSASGRVSFDVNAFTTKASQVAMRAFMRIDAENLDLFLAAGNDQRSFEIAAGRRAAFVRFFGRTPGPLLKCAAGGFEAATDVLRRLNAALAPCVEQVVDGFDSQLADDIMDATGRSFLRTVFAG